MRLLFSAAAKEFRLIWRDRFGLALWISIPVIILAVMNLAFGGSSSSGPRPRGTLLLADLDGTFLSGMVGSAFSQGPLGDLFTVEKTAEADGRVLMSRGKASALIVVPKGFQDQVLLNQPVTLSLITNPSQRILPAIAGQSLTILSEAVHYLHLVAGDQLRLFAQQTGRPTQAQVVAASIAFHRIGDDLSAYLDPMILDIVIQEQQKEQKKESAPFNLTSYLFPGMLFMTFLFLARGSSDGLWEELAHGTLRRWHASGAPTLTFVAARLIASCLVATLVGILALGAANLLLGVPVANWTAALAWIACGSAVWFLIMLNLQILAGVERNGEILTSFVIFPSMMFGGSMFPFAMMPDSIAAIGKATPLGWMVVGFDGILRGQSTAAQVGLGLTALAAVAALLFLVSGWHLKRKFLRG